MLSLPETHAHAQDAETLDAAKCFRGGKVFVQILHDNGVFSALWDFGGYFQGIFFLHFCLNTRRKLFELPPKRNK